MAQGSRRLPMYVESNTGKVVVGDGNDYEHVSMPAYTGADDAQMVVGKVDALTGRVEAEVHGIDVGLLTKSQVTDVVGPPVVNSIMPDDWYAGTILANDGTWLYARNESNAKQVVRYPVSGLADESARVLGHNFDTTAAAGGILAIKTTSTPGLVFAAVYDATTTNSTNIWRSTDYGATFTKVLELGVGYYGAMSTRIDNVRFLSERSMLEFTDPRTGQRTFAIGEYNVSGGRVAGSTNDRNCLWKSVDDGLTWQLVAEFNADGSTQHIRHFHALIWNPYTSRVLICGGDTNAQACIIPWDGGTLPSNTTPKNITGAKTGSQRFRLCDMVFDEGYGYYLSDFDDTDTTNNTTHDAGVWRFDARTMANSSWSKIDSGCISELPGRWGFLACKTADGHIFFADSMSRLPADGEHFISVYALNSSRDRLHRVGEFRSHKTGTTEVLRYVDTFMPIGNKVFMNLRGISNIQQTKAGTACFRTTDQAWAGVADTIHPAYWCDPDAGTDDTATGRGLSPRSPYKTWGYALTGKMPFGAVLVMDWEGEKRVDAATTAPAFITTNADATQRVEIRGRSPSATAFGLSSAATASGDIYVGSQAFNLRLRDVWWKTWRKSAGQNLLRNNNATAGSTLAKFSAYRCNIGNVWIDNSIGYEEPWPFDTVLASQRGAQASQATLYCNAGAGGMSVVLDGCVVMAPRGAGNTITYSATNAVSVTLNNTVLNGNGAQILFNGSGSTLTADGCLFYNYKGSAITVQSAATVAPVLRNCVFSVGRQATAQEPQIIDETAGDITASGKVIGAKCSAPLAVTGSAAASVFDATSKQIPWIAPRDPLNMDYTIIE